MGKVLLQKEGSVATIVINREERLNSFDYETLQTLAHIVEDLKTDEETRVVIFTGAGNKSFSAGADLKERKSLNKTQVKRNVLKIREVFNQIESLPQPTIAAINGIAFGGGMELALACDFRIASNNAEFGLTEVSWGIVPGGGGTQRLTRLIGLPKAKELILTARKIDASAAYTLGLINEITEMHGLFPAIHSLTEEILNNAPLAVSNAKYAISRGYDTDFYTGLALESQAYEAIIDTEDRIEALNAFKEKRPPQFQGN